MNDLLSILEDALDSLRADGSRNIVIGDFSQALEQHKAAEDSIGTPRLVFSFECPRDIAESRYMCRSHSGRDADPAVFDKRYEDLSQLERPCGRVLREKSATCKSGNAVMITIFVLQTPPHQAK